MLDFVHLEWPNVAAVLMLAILPFVALMLPTSAPGRSGVATPAVETLPLDAQCPAPEHADAPAMTAPRLI